MIHSSDNAHLVWIINVVNIQFQQPFNALSLLSPNDISHSFNMLAIRWGKYEDLLARSITFGNIFSCEHSLQY